MNYQVTDDGVQFFGDDDKPITLDAALVTVRRVAAYVEEIGNEPKRSDDAETRMDQPPAA